MSVLLPDQKFIVVDWVKLKVHKDFDPDKYTGCNGCGAGWNTRIVPDSIYFVSIRMACCPHDFRYELGGTLEDKKIADEEFLYNMIAIVESVKKWYYPTSLARSRAMTYYSAVASLGDDVFLANNTKGDADVGNSVEHSVNAGRGDSGAGKRRSDHGKHRLLRLKHKQGV